MANQGDKSGQPKNPSAADQFQNITSPQGKPPSEEDANRREEGTTQIKQTAASLLHRLRGIFGRSGRSR